MASRSKSKKSYLPFGTIRVPNQLPTFIHNDYKVALIGEAPGETEVEKLTPFSGASGWLLEKRLASAGLVRSACFVGNIFQYRPADNKIATVDRRAPEWGESASRLAEELHDFDPNVVVLMGGTALEAFTGHKKIAQWRGSVIPGTFGGREYKVLPTWHPAAVLREFKHYPILGFDLERAKFQGGFPEIRRKPRVYELDLSCDEILERFATVRRNRLRVAYDIEGGYKYDPISCIGFATDPQSGFIVAFQTLQGNRKTGQGYSVWSRPDEMRLLRGINELLNDPDVEKVGQNAISYDEFVLGHNYGIAVRNRQDTMLLNWEIFPEQPKSLGFQNSIWTDEPFYKSERKTTEDSVFWKYCIKDACTTLEIFGEQEAYLRTEEAERYDEAWGHYRFNVEVNEALLYAMLRGMRYDEDAVREVVKNVSAELGEKQARFEAILGKPLNVKSWKQKGDWLYNQKGYKYYDKKTKKWNSSTSENTLIHLWKQNDDPEIKLLLDCVRLRTALSNLAYDSDGTPQRNVVDRDGRIRFSYNPVGTKTGRLGCSKPPTGGGFNGQTITVRKGANMRLFYRADEGCAYGQADLEGADSWTVAAHCDRLGDSSMLDHLRAGIKPAKVLRLVMEIGIANVKRLDIQELRTQVKAMPSDDMYTVAKQVGHGTSYLMGPDLTANLVYKGSEGAIALSESEGQKYQDLFLKLYPGVIDYQNYVLNFVSENQYIDSASGHRRYFLAIRWGRHKKTGKPIIDHETWRQAVAQEPQANTTYVTNRIFNNLYREAYNRDDQGRFILEPLHQVHDAVNFQFDTRHIISGKAKEVFALASDFSIEIAGQDIRIPIEAKYGPSWGEGIYAL
jgi:uracil-DNA glycosylase family 4